MKSGTLRRVKINLSVIESIRKRTLIKLGTLPANVTFPAVFRDLGVILLQGNSIKEIPNRSGFSL
jgi:hypothetical protein